MFRMDLQLFADLDEIISGNAEAFEGFDLEQQFNPFATKLNELGYEVLINNKQKAEFIPAGRLGEVVSQRDGFKKQVEELNASLVQLQGKAGDNQQLKDDYQNLINQNELLLKDLETTRINTEIMMEAKNAINAKDVLAFINYEDISVNSKGEVLGVEAEVNRLRAEKPYLFQEEQQKKFGTDGSGSGGHGKPDQATGMNALIRRTAGRLY